MATNIRISQVIEDLNRGLTRTPGTGGYNPEVGSIQEKYNLSSKEVKILFEHPRLKGRRTGKAVTFNIIDDTEESILQFSRMVLMDAGSTMPGEVLERPYTPIEAFATTPEVNPNTVIVETVRSLGEDLSPELDAAIESNGW